MARHGSGNASELDARSDVYSVGVITYELLTGRLPYDLQGKMFPELARIIREQQPTRLRALDRRLHGDVEAIVSKALEKEPERRYSSAADMASDIRRHLVDQPITARPLSLAYRVRTFVRRRRPLVTSSAVGVAGAVMLVAGALALAGNRSPGPGTAQTRPTRDYVPGATSPGLLRIRSADAWLAANPRAEAYAFDEFYAGVPGMRILAGREVPVTLALASGTVTLSAFDVQGDPRNAIVDLARKDPASDALIMAAGILVMEFDPPITADVALDFACVFDQ